MMAESPVIFDSQSDGGEIHSRGGWQQEKEEAFFFPVPQMGPDGGTVVGAVPLQWSLVGDPGSTTLVTTLIIR